MSTTVVHYIDTREFGGAERSLLHLLAALDRDRYRPVLFHVDAPGLEPLVRGARSAGVETRAVPVLRGRRSSFRIPRFSRLLQAEEPALLHAHLNWPLACTAGILASASAGVPVVATVQLFSDFPRALTMPLQRRFVVPVVHRYIAVSRHVSDAIERVLGAAPARISVVPNGIPADDFAPPPTGARAQPGPGGAAPAPTVLTLARLDRQKGIDCLLRAAVELPGVTFVIAGEGPEREALARLARTLGVHDRVTFPGRREDVPALLGSADVFALPSRNEGLPLALLEAQAAGVPIVATSIGGVMEIIRDGDNGLLVPPDDAGALARAVRRLLDDARLAARLAAAGRARVRESYTAEAMAKSVMSIYDELLATHGGAARRR